MAGDAPLRPIWTPPSQWPVGRSVDCRRLGRWDRSLPPGLGRSRRFGRLGGHHPSATPRRGSHRGRSGHRACRRDHRRCGRPVGADSGDQLRQGVPCPSRGRPDQPRLHTTCTERPYRQSVQAAGARLPTAALPGGQRRGRNDRSGGRLSSRRGTARRGPGGVRSAIDAQRSFPMVG